MYFTGSCEHDDEPSGSINGGEFLDHMNDFSDGHLFYFHRINDRRWRSGASDGSLLSYLDLWWLFDKEHFIRFATNQPTPWSRVLLDKLTVTQLVKKFSAFYGPKGLSPSSQEPATGPYTEPDAFIPHLPPVFP